MNTIDLSFGDHKVLLLPPTVSSESWKLEVDGGYAFPVGRGDAEVVVQEVRERYLGESPPEDHTQIWRGYRCMDCGAHGVRLWRDYQTVLAYQRTRCRWCSLEDQGKHGRRLEGDQVGWLVPAVPTADGSTFWGYSSVPMKAVDWWKQLPFSMGPLISPRKRSRRVAKKIAKRGGLLHHPKNSR